MRFAAVHWQTLLAAAAVAALAIGGFLFWWRRRPTDPEETERRRRSYLNQVGRIVEGQILEITEAPPNPSQTAKGRGLFPRAGTAAQGRGASSAGHLSNDARTLVFYSYSISGVTYETAQDITGFEERACLDRVFAGQPASVKYDPANPGNSILIADDWSGLH